MIVITGATGHLGRLVVEQLLQKVSAQEVAVVVRNVEKASDFARLGVQVRAGDYNRPESLTTAFQGATKVLLISGNELGKRTEQHKNVVAAVKASGAKFLVYTSILGADTAQISLATEHLATERVIQASGIPYVILRNGWYIENYTENLGSALQFGAIAGSAGVGKISAAARADYAAAAVAVLLQEGPTNHIYELAGDSAFTMSELAGEVARQSGKTVVYNDLPSEQYAGLLKSFGLPGPVAEMLADADVAITRGELETSRRDLQQLIGRETTPLAAGVAAALRA